MWELVKQKNNIFIFHYLKLISVKELKLSFLCCSANSAPPPPESFGKLRAGRDGDEGDV